MGDDSLRGDILSKAGSVKSEMDLNPVEFLRCQAR